MKLHSEVFQKVPIIWVWS